MTYLFTSESVGMGHPDKIADQISDAILDACLEQDPYSRVACEAVVTSGLVFLAGEITTHAQFAYDDIVRRTIESIGYNQGALGFDFRSCGIIQSIHKQSPDIARGLNKEESLFHDQGAGDQGIMFGYACDETPELMPLAISLSHKIVQSLRSERESGNLSWLLPDGKSQVTVEYQDDGTPIRVHTVVVSTQHLASVDQKTITEEMISLVKKIIPEKLLDAETRYLINPTGRFVIGGPTGDCGLTGRKTMVDSYGGAAHHGGGAFSGKDPTKVDRSGAYAARYIAKNIVAAGLCKRCEVQLSYAIGYPEPISIKVDTFGTGTVPEKALCKAIPQVFKLNPTGLIEMLDLRKPIFERTAFGGHFGREEPGFTWENTDKVTALKELVLT